MMGAAEVKRLEHELARAERATATAFDKLAALPRGSFRAQVTRANARWKRAAEHRDRVAAQLEAARAAVQS